MQITKNVNCGSLEELIELTKKLKKKASIKNFNFSGSYNKENKSEHFSVGWTEEEDV